uniref:Peptidase S1 domain-containing protein n=1 Tax=Ditylenchus dipsaci TaxID=166011 RepID=A0A915D7K8_9BILA
MVSLNEDEAKQIKSDCKEAWNNIPNRVIGGQLASPSSHNYAVVFLDEMENVFCTGVLITRRHVLSNRHCVDFLDTHSDNLGRRRNFFLMGGGTCHSDVITPECPHGKDMLLLEHTTVAYDSSFAEPKFYLYTYDIALIMLKTPITVTAKLNHICVSHKKLENFASGSFSLAGWGQKMWTYMTQQMH